MAKKTISSLLRKLKKGAPEKLQEDKEEERRAKKANIKPVARSKRDLRNKDNS